MNETTINTITTVVSVIAIACGIAALCLAPKRAILAVLTIIAGISVLTMVVTVAAGRTPSLPEVVVAVCVVAVGLWQMYQKAKIVRNRTELRARVEGLDGFFYERRSGSLHKDDPKNISWIQALLGDVPIHVIIIPPTSTPADVKEIRHAFPEAVVYQTDQGDGTLQDARGW